MTTVIVDRELREKLHGFEHTVTLCDESGALLGRVLPEALYMKMLYEQAKHMFTEEELRRAEQEPGARPLAEILADLQRKYPA